MERKASDASFNAIREGLERPRPIGLNLIGAAQVIFGIVFSYASSVFFAGRPLSAIGLTAGAFLTLVALAAIWHVAAGLFLLSRRWGRRHVVVWAQRIAMVSLLPMFFGGIVLGSYAVRAIYAGNDMFAGYGVILSLVITAAAATLALLALVALRIIRVGGG